MDPVEPQTDASTDLRAHLRAATMAAHDLLDAAMQAASGWQQRSDYARFLALQHAARVPLETWLVAHAPRDLAPPLQTPLIAADLAALGVALPPSAPAFDLPQSRSGNALGAVWVLAGSALGNRAIAKQVSRIGGGEWPTAFLGDDAMMGFWRGLRVRIESHGPSAEVEGAADAAAAVFAHFLAVAEHGQPHSVESTAA